MATERLKNVLNELNIDFVKYRYICAGLSVVAVLFAWFLFFVYPGPNWGIDFTGGTEIHLKFEDDVDVGVIRKALHKLGLSEDAVYSVGPADKHEFKVRIQDATFGAEDARKDVEQRLVGKYGPDWIEHTTFNAEVGARVVVTYKGQEVPARDVQKLFGDMQGVSVRPGSLDNQLVVQLPGLSHQIETRIREVLPDHQFTVLKTDAVGPKVGAELRVQAFIAILATIGLVLTYIAFRFDISFAPGAVVALIHDVSVVSGAFVLADKEFSLSIIGALLTILGYSLNDTVIIYDRLRENKERPRRT
jgi:preprotein translocase subunit SecF